MPQIAHKTDRAGFDISGGGWGLIIFTPRTMGQAWILGFAAWRALEAFCPFLLLCREIVVSEIPNAPGQTEADRAFEEAIAKAEELKTIDNLESYTWPVNIPEPDSTVPEAMTERATIDLIKIATAYVFLHEIRHVMFDADGNRPPDPREEELACDIFARDFLMERIPDYVVSSGYRKEDVSNKRLMGLALGAFVVLCITKDWSGSDSHPAVAARLRELVKESTVPGMRTFIYASSLLLGILRRTGKLPPRIPFSDPPDLFGKLLRLI